MREVEFCLLFFKLFIFISGNSIFVNGLSSSWEGRRSFSYGFPWGKERMFINCYFSQIPISLFFLKTYIGDTEVCVLSSALKVNSSLTLLNLAFIKYSITLYPFMPALHSISNNIGDTGISSLSSALEVNSTLTSLDLRMCFV